MIGGKEEKDMGVFGPGSFPVWSSTSSHSSPQAALSGEACKLLLCSSNSCLLQAQAGMACFQLQQAPECSAKTCWLLLIFPRPLLNSPLDLAEGAVSLHPGVLQRPRLLQKEIYQKRQQRNQQDSYTEQF